MVITPACTMTGSAGAGPRLRPATGRLLLGEISVNLGCYIINIDLEEISTVPHIIVLYM